VSTNLRLHLPRLSLSLGGGAFFALALQIIAFNAPLGDDVPRRVLLLLSYVVLIGFVAVNLRRIGISIIGIGLLLNFVAIAANGGLMPVTAETLAHGGFPSDVSVGEWVPGSKDVLLSRDDVRLWFLSDRFVLEALPRTLAYSLGDVIILMGLVVFLGEMLLPRISRAKAPTPGSDSQPQNGDA